MREEKEEMNVIGIKKVGVMVFKRMVEIVVIIKMIKIM